MEMTTNINAFIIGMTTAYYALMSYQLFVGEKKGSTRLHKTMGWIFAAWTINNAKDIILTFPGMYTEAWLDRIIIADGWSALTYMAFLYELTQPGWITASRVAKAAIPFAAYTLLYILHPCHDTIFLVLAFLVSFGLYITFIGYKHSISYMNRVKSLFSNIDDIDISWLRKLYLLSAISLLSWLFVSVYANAYADILYYVISASIWQMAICHCRGLKQIEPKELVSGSEEKEDPAKGKREYNFCANPEKAVEGEELYLIADLTLDDLAKRLGTNRTYLSQYLSRNIGKTFYDYINELRIVKKSIPLICSHPEYTMERIAKESGFNSIATYRRAFRKITGTTPSAYKEQYGNMR